MKGREYPGRVPGYLPQRPKPPMPFGTSRPDTAASATADAFSADALALLDSLYGTAMRLARNPDMAQDLLQDTYLKAFRARARFAAGTNLKAWLFTILHNTWRNRRRDQARSRVEYDSDVVEQAGETGSVSSPVETPETLLLRASFDEELRSALEALPDAFREAVWLRDVEELSYQEIAAVLVIPIGTVMSRISRGRKQLYQLLVTSRERVAQPVQTESV
jgi:RNA polymerase sigma-70 factor (ECF subfamily)